MELDGGKTLNCAFAIGEILEVDLVRPRDRLQLAHDPHYHRLRSQVLEFLYSRQMRPKEAA